MVRCKAPINSKAQGPGGPTILRLKPLAHAIALLMVAGSAHGATVFSAGWFADKGASQAATAARTQAQMPKIPSLNQQAKVNQQLQRTLTTLNTTVAAIAAQQAAQAAGRQAALGQVTTIADGRRQRPRCHRVQRGLVRRQGRVSSRHCCANAGADAEDPVTEPAG